jgi:hypothetical protein
MISSRQNPSSKFDDVYNYLYDLLKKNIKSQLLQLFIIKKIGGMPSSKSMRKFTKRINQNLDTSDKIKKLVKNKSVKNKSVIFLQPSKKNISINTILKFKHILKIWINNKEEFQNSFNLDNNIFNIIKSNLEEIDELINEIVESLIITFFNIYLDLKKPDFKYTVEYLIELMNEPEQFIEDRINNVIAPLSSEDEKMSGGASVNDINDIKGIESNIISIVNKYNSLWNDTIEKNKIVTDKRKILKDAYKKNKDEFYKEISLFIKEYDNINFNMSVIKNAWTFMMPTEDIKINEMFKNIKESLLREFYKNKIVKQTIEKDKIEQEKEKEQNQLSSGEIGTIHGMHTDALTTIFIKRMMRMTGLITDDDEEIIAMSKNSQVIRVDIKEIPTLSRATQGVRVMKLREGDALASLVCL